MARSPQPAACSPQPAARRIVNLATTYEKKNINNFW